MAHFGGLLGARGWAGRVGLAWAVCCAGASVARAAENDDDQAAGRASETRPDEAAFSGSAGALYGGLPGASDSVNPFGVGLGLRLGVTLPVQVYVGVSYEHFFGGPTSSFSNIASYETDAVLDQVHGWVGYEVPLDGLTLRPCLGLGGAYMREETLTTDARGQTRREDDALGLLVSPALQLLFPVGGAALVVEGRYSMVPEAVAEADALLVGVGFGAEL
jgi:hypothetical protein